MKHIIAIALAVICLPSICFSTPEEDVLRKAQERYQWLPKEMKISKTRDGIDGKVSFSYHSKDPYQYFQIDQSGLIVSANWNSSGDPKLFPERNEEFVWSLRPDMSRQKMVKTGRSFYYLKRNELMHDTRLSLSMNTHNGVVCGFYARNDIDNRPIPVINITKQQAIKIAEDQVRGFVHHYRADEQRHWPCYFKDNTYLDSISIATDFQGSLFAEYQLVYRLSLVPVANPDSLSERQLYVYPIMCIRVNATTGDIIDRSFDIIGVSGAIIGLVTDKPASAPASVQVSVDGKPRFNAYPCIFVDGSMYVSITTLQSLAKPHTVAARAGDASFKLNSAKIELSAKVIDRKGIPYLPWQSINSLPGCKAEFDAEGYKLKITTPAAKAAAPTTK